jgi:enoyl-CoA hydratase/carnithine racemase
MDEIRRSLEALEIDEMSKMVILKSEKEEVFSYGTDLKYLYYKKKNGEIEQIDKYLQKLYKLQNYIANYHKPLVTICTGLASKIIIN